MGRGFLGIPGQIRKMAPPEGGEKTGLWGPLKPGGLAGGTQPREHGKKKKKGAP